MHANLVVPLRDDGVDARSSVLLVGLVHLLQDVIHVDIGDRRKRVGKWGWLEDIDATERLCFIFEVHFD
jgi:hypothetical protein